MGYFVRTLIAPFAMLFIIIASITLLLCLAGCDNSSRPSSVKSNDWYPRAIVWSPHGTYVAVEEAQVESGTGKQINSQVQILSGISGARHLIVPFPALSPVWINDDHLLVAVPQPFESRQQVGFYVIDCGKKRPAL